MKSDRLQDAIGEIRDDLIEDAHANDQNDGKKKPGKNRKRWVSIAAACAACLVLVTAISVNNIQGPDNPNVLIGSTDSAVSAEQEEDQNTEDALLGKNTDGRTESTDSSAEKEAGSGEEKSDTENSESGSDTTASSDSQSAESEKKDSETLSDKDASDDSSNTKKTGTSDENKAGTSDKKKTGTSNVKKSETSDKKKTGSSDKKKAGTSNTKKARASGKDKKNKTSGSETIIAQKPQKSKSADSSDASATRDSSTATTDGSSKTTKAGKKKNAVCDGPYGRISLSVPKGWKYQILKTGSKKLNLVDYGIHFYPRGKEGYVEVGYQKAFGICGTGLTEKTKTLAGSKAIVGYYDGQKIWDFIRFDGENEGLTAWNYHIEKWTAVQQKKAFKILNSLKYDSKMRSGASNSKDGQSAGSEK